MSDKKINISLDNLSINETGIIVEINHATTSIKQRLLEMGLTIGTKIKIKRYAPLGDPIEIMIRNYRLSIRRNEARHIIVQKVQL